MMLMTMSYLARRIGGLDEERGSVFRSTSSKNYEVRVEHDFISLGASILPLHIAAGSPVASILPLHMAAGGVSCVVCGVNFYSQKKGSNVLFGTSFSFSQS